ncbi:hypothetical protein C8J57DRAFT_1321235 [Mycena rebaudengoi]|nr:hypothetical protein C8J57DRAFT_1321235 [Mycena rebaudengoi]
MRNNFNTFQNCMYLLVHWRRRRRRRRRKKRTNWLKEVTFGTRGGMECWFELYSGFWIAGVWVSILLFFLFNFPQLCPYLDKYIPSWYAQHAIFRNHSLFVQYVASLFIYFTHLNGD